MRAAHDGFMIALMRIISGGQTGADQGGLAAAKKLGLSTGGLMPRGFLTEAGARPDFAALYGMKEHWDASYIARTEANVRDADGTLIIGDASSGGTRETKNFCAKHRKPCFVVPWHSGQPVPLESVPGFRRWLAEQHIRTLNVAGNRESGQVGIHDAVLAFLLEALQGQAGPGAGTWSR
jgi:hypothetical protein